MSDQRSVAAASVSCFDGREKKRDSVALQGIKREILRLTGSSAHSLDRVAGPELGSPYYSAWSKRLLLLIVEGLRFTGKLRPSDIQMNIADDVPHQLCFIPPTNRYRLFLRSTCPAFNSTGMLRSLNISINTRTLSVPGNRVSKIAS